MIQIEAYCGGVFQTNGYLVTVNEGEKRYLFDAPDKVADWLSSNDIESLDGLILTHQHHDHVVGAGALQEKFPCKTYAFCESSDDLTLAHRLEEVTGLPCSLDEYQIDEFLENQSELSLDGLNLEILHIPGHSPDSLCFRIEGQPVIVAGDVLFRGSIGRTDFPHGDHDALISGIREKLWPLDDELQVLPGHGPPTTIGLEKKTNPYVSE